MNVRPAKTQISLGIRPVWSVFAVRMKKAWVFRPIERTAKTDQTGRMPRMIWVFAGRTVALLVLSCRGSNIVLLIYLFIYLFIYDILLNRKKKANSCDKILTVDSKTWIAFLYPDTEQH